jgi:hypothetical protein
MQLHSILLAMNNKGITIYINPFNHKQYTFDSLNKN